MEERPVPKEVAAPGEWYSPTQPFPLKPPPLARMTWKKDEITSFTPEHKQYCEALFKDAQSDGPFAPVRMTNTVVFPGPDGGFNWGGGSFDPKLGYFFINSHDRGEVTKMVPRTAGESWRKARRAGNRRSPLTSARTPGNIVNPATQLALSVASVGLVIRNQRVSTGDVATAPSLWQSSIARSTRIQGHGIVQHRRIGRHRRRSPIHRRDRRSALPRLRIQNRQVAMGN